MAQADSPKRFVLNWWLMSAEQSVLSMLVIQSSSVDLIILHTHSLAKSYNETCGRMKIKPALADTRYKGVFGYGTRVSPAPPSEQCS